MALGQDLNCQVRSGSYKVCQQRGVRVFATSVSSRPALRRVVSRIMLFNRLFYNALELPCRLPKLSV